MFLCHVTSADDAQPAEAERGRDAGDDGQLPAAPIHHHARQDGAEDTRESHDGNEPRCFLCESDNDDDEVFEGGVLGWRVERGN